VDVQGADRVWVVASVLRTIARDALGDPDAAGRALRCALDLAEPDVARFPFLVQPPPDLPGHHAWHDLISAAAPGQLAYHHETLTQGETRVLHYLPTNLSAREIAGELYLSVNTVKTHQRHLYQKLGARNRSQAVERARALGLLARPVGPGPFGRG